MELLPIGISLKKNLGASKAETLDLHLKIYRIQLQHSVETDFLKKKLTAAESEVEERILQAEMEAKFKKEDDFLFQAEAEAEISREVDEEHHRRLGDLRKQLQQMAYALDLKTEQISQLLELLNRRNAQLYDTQRQLYQCNTGS